MSVFGIIKCDDQVFKGDKLRIEVGDSFLAPGLSFHPTLSHEISVDSGVTWYNISTPKKVDWIFATTGSKTISLRLTPSVGSSETFTKTVTVLDQVTQALFSMDNDLYAYEPEIDQYLPKKWSSWNMIHLAAQKWIIDWLDEKGLRNEEGDKYTAADVLDPQQLKQFSCYKALEIIFEGNSSIPGDLSSLKRDKYKALVNEKAAKSNLQLDFDGDEEADNDERTNLHAVIIRRA